MITQAEVDSIVAYLRENPNESWNPLYDAVEELAIVTRQPPFTNSIGMEFVWIPPGRFMMGSPDSDEEAFTWEKPQHEVVLTRGYWMGKYPVTRGQYVAFMNATGCVIPKNWRHMGFTQSEDHPVISIRFEESVEFCRWLSEQDDGDYRLPTETEWEYACRAGTTTPRYNGLGLEALSEIAWYFENCEDESTVTVEQLEPNAWGLYDMLGNVWEQCSTYWNQNYPSVRQIDDAEPPEGRFRVQRGGGWSTEARDCRSASRSWNPHVSGVRDLGFRVVRTAS